MSDFRKFFKGKKITIMGLGLLGRGVGDALFLAESGAKLTITDLKPSTALRPSLKKLRKFKNIKFTLGEHRLEDFRNADMILKAAGVPLDSIYIREARENNIPVEMSASLFAKLSGVPLIGVTGTRGKSTTTHLIAHILQSAGKKVILGGNIRGVANLQLLKKVKRADVAVFELDSWQLQGFGEARISPHIAVFTNFLSDHFNYYKNHPKQYFTDKSYIFKYQKKGDLLIVGKQAAPFVAKWGGKIKSKIIITEEKLSKGWVFNLSGAHNEYNAQLAIEVSRQFSIPDVKIKKALATFAPLSGRLEFLRSINGVKIYNDNNSTTPDATIAALRALGDKKKRKVVLIIGGDNKFLDMSRLIREISKFCSKVVLFSEKGTDLIREEIFKLKKKGVMVYEEEGLKNTVNRAWSISKSGETILYSPAFSSFGKYFKNEYDRGDKFMKIVKELSQHAK